MSKCLTALVLAMESLNKLESRFAVMRFGGEKTQVFITIYVQTMIR